MNRRELAALDAYITRTPDEVEMWCDSCGLNSDDCEEPEEHEGHWITMAERAADEAEDYAYDMWNDEERE